MSETAIKIEHVSKEYRLGAIGGGTLKGDLQSLSAKIRGKSNPNAKIGQDYYAKNERFLALDDVSFSVKKGERIGIIGHNGAGKSTLLKLLSRVTAPTKGTISYNGRIASMLEVGTGFHPELTGRENVYLNGAILGMSKAEIDTKFDDIVSFAEMEQFIDTPVKRYSSGMYVKLAFAVAAHLDSEILVMDEVLAVGDMKFQQKCLGKMDDVSKNEGRTVLYVSHNMNTIRQLCTRCIVLDHGKVIFDGDVENAVHIYMGEVCDLKTGYDYSSVIRKDGRSRDLELSSLQIRGKQQASFERGEAINVEIHCKSNRDVQNAKIRFEFFSSDNAIIGSSFCDAPISLQKGNELTVSLLIPTAHFAPGLFRASAFTYVANEFGTQESLDKVETAFLFEITNPDTLTWLPAHWGHVRFDDVIACDSIEKESTPS